MRCCRPSTIFSGLPLCFAVLSRLAPGSLFHLSDRGGGVRDPPVGCRGGPRLLAPGWPKPVCKVLFFNAAARVPSHACLWLICGGCRAGGHLSPSFRNPNGRVGPSEGLAEMSSPSASSLPSRLPSRNLRAFATAREPQRSSPALTLLGARPLLADEGGGGGSYRAQRATWPLLTARRSPSQVRPSTCLQRHRCLPCGRGALELPLAAPLDPLGPGIGIALFSPSSGPSQVITARAPLSSRVCITSV